MTKDAGERVAEALGGVVNKIEKATDAVVGKLEAITDETVNKLGRVEDKYVGMFSGVNATLDDLIGGHNGPPVADEPATYAEAIEPATFRGKISALGEPVPVPEWTKTNRE